MNECLLPIRMAWAKTCFCPLPTVPIPYTDYSLPSLPLVQVPEPFLLPSTYCPLPPVMSPFFVPCGVCTAVSHNMILCLTLIFTFINSTMCSQPCLWFWNLMICIFCTTWLLNSAIYFIWHKETLTCSSSKGKLLDLFKDSRLCSGLDGQFKGFFQGYFLPIKNFTLHSDFIAF